MKSFAARRCILNTHIRVAAGRSGAGGAVQAERQTVPKFSFCSGIPVVAGQGEFIVNLAVCEVFWQVSVCRVV